MDLGRHRGSGRHHPRAFYSDGIRVRINDAEDSPAPNSRGMHFVDVQVNVRNGSRGSFDPTGIHVSMRAGAGRKPANLVKRDSFGNSMPPATERFADWLFLVPAGEVHDLEIRITVAPDHEPVVFRGGSVPEQ